MDFQTALQSTQEFGVVSQVKYPLAVVAGLPSARLHEIAIFENGMRGEVFTVLRDTVQVLLLSKDAPRVGFRATRTNTFLSIPVGNELLGRVIDPLGNPIASAPSFRRPREMREIERVPVGISERARIKKPLITGISIIDMMVPLGYGQKELVIGDRKVGKSSFLLAIIKNQVEMGSIAIYAVIAKRKSDIKTIESYFERFGIREKTIIVATVSSDSPAFIFLTPYTAITLAEYFRDQGQNVLVIFDDLSTHAKFYREISLLANRFPGRDSYPGDIFYTHARLLERVGNFKHATAGEVAISALPVAEIIEGDFSGYIATNIMGMTDGHIYLDSSIYYTGRRPAVNIPLSVTRVGRQTQSKLLQSINRELSAFLALYEKTQNLSHFGAELTESVKEILKTGEAIYDFFNQHYTVVIPLEVEILLFGMVWSKQFTLDPATILAYRDNLIGAYKIDAHKKLFQELVAVDNLNELLSNIQKQKEALLTLCRINTQ